MSAASSDGQSAVEKGSSMSAPLRFEIMTGLKRAGADVIVTYWARELAKWLGSKNRVETARHVG